MTTETTRTAAPLTDDGDLIAAARALAPQVQAAREEIEQERRLPPALVRAMAEAGLFRMWLPRTLGGREAHPATFIRVVEEVAKVDGSAGWCLMIGAGAGVFSGYLAEAVAQRIYGGHPNVVTGGQFGPHGQALPVDGGYRVSGRWTFASGCQHSDWLLSGCLIVDGDRPRLDEHGAPDWRLLYLPASEARIIDTWSAGGLRGTGSHDTAVEDHFVPTERVITFWDRPVQPGTLYAFPIFGLLAAALCSVALGIARGAIDALVSLATVKTPMGAGTLLSERAVVQAEVAQAEALLRSARAFLFETIGETWDALSAGEEVSLEQRALLSLAAVHASDSAACAVDLMYNAGGGSAVYTSSPLERAFRDVHTATHHLLVQRARYEPAGRALLGMDVADPLL